jgi:oxygen-dependent protoporphyrinogen oxidase
MQLEHAFLKLSLESRIYATPTAGMSRVIVLGGGIGGLSAAWRLAKRLDPSCVTVLEASNRVGGWIESTQTEDGAVFEHGPRSLRLPANGASASISLVEELGLGDQVSRALIGANDQVTCYLFVRMFYSVV